jgi:hypothetical protein
MEAIIGGVSGFIVLLMTYIGTKQATPKAPQIQEIRMHGLTRATEKTSTPGMLFPGLSMEPLRRSDYDVVGVAEGKGCAHYVALWPLPIFWVKREGGAIKFFSYDSEGVATNAAWYEAIESVPKADVMFSPRIRTREENKFALWYRRNCVSLSAKGLEIKLDQKK